MIRKTVFALAAVATIAATALIPTEAAAKSWKGKNFGRFAIGAAIVLGTAVAVNASCWRYVENRYGEIEKVWVCN